MITSRPTIHVASLVFAPPPIEQDNGDLMLVMAEPGSVWRSLGYLAGTPTELDDFARRILAATEQHGRAQVEATMTPLVAVVPDRFASTHGTDAA